jgi:hypothetical protein
MTAISATPHINVLIVPSPLPAVPDAMAQIAENLKCH